MSNKEFSEKLKAGIELAGKRMLEEKALRGEDVIVSADGKTIERIPATQLLWRVLGASCARSVAMLLTNP